MTTTGTNESAGPRRSIAPPEVAARSSVVGGASITIAWRLIDRLISLVSTPILARLLTPEDFGLVAMASVAAGLVGVFLELGVNAALIQQRNPTPEHFDAAFTLRLIQAGTAGVFIFALSWPAAAYFDDPRLVGVIQVVAATSVVGGFENIGIVLLQKHFEFRRELRYFLARRLISFAVTISLAFALRTYWALVLGTLIGQIVSVTLSYVVQPFRPRVGLARVRDILSFSQWVVVRGIGHYISSSLPSLLLGRHASAAAVGIYRGGSELSSLAAGEVLAPLARVLYPALVEARESVEAFRRAVSLALGIQFMFAMPACVGIALVADEAVAVLLGPKWNEAAPVLRLLALGNAFVVFHHTGGYALMAMGKIKVQAIMTWVDAALFAALALALLAQFKPEAVAEIRLIVTTMIVWSYAALLSQSPLRIPWSAILRSFARPLAACGVMALALVALDFTVAAAPVYMLALKIGVGTFAYTIVVLVLWRIAGRPAGAEQYLIDKLFGVIAHRRYGPSKDQTAG